MKMGNSWTETTVALKTQTDQETKYIQNSTGDGRSWSDNSKGKNDREKNGIKIETERCMSVRSNWSIPRQSSTLPLAGFAGGQGTTRAGKAKSRNSSLSPPMLQITIHSWTPTFPRSYHSGTAYGYIEQVRSPQKNLSIYYFILHRCRNAYRECCLKQL